jgi:hypothetical protein
MGYPYTSDAGRPYTGGLGPDSPVAWWSSADVTNAPKPPLLPRYRFEAPVDVFVRQGNKPSVEVLPKQPANSPVWSSSPQQASGLDAQTPSGNGAPVQYTQYNTYYNAPWVGSVGPGTVSLGPNGQLVVTSRPPHPPQQGHHPEGFAPPPAPAGGPEASLPPRLLQEFPPEVMAALATLRPDGFDPSTTSTGTGQHRLAPGMLHQAWQASGLGLPPATNTSETTGTPNTRPFTGLGASMPTGLSTYDPFTGKPNVPFDPITGQATGFWPFDPRNGQPVNAPGSLNPYGALNQGAAGLPRTALTNDLPPAPVTPAITPPPPGPASSA